MEEANKSAILITHLTDESYRLLRNLVFPSDLETLSYKDLVKSLNVHFTPKRCTFADRAKFYSATKTPDETLGDWAARLRGLAITCDFGTALETVLRDRFVLGLASGPERDKLFSEDAASLTFARALEVAEQAASARQGKESVPAVNASVKEEPIFRMWTGSGRERGGAGAGAVIAGRGAGVANTGRSVGARQPLPPAPAVMRPRRQS